LIHFALFRRDRPHGDAPAALSLKHFAETGVPLT
jgi:hypothetical protein